ncbi:MAG: lytic transglycosylase domain-containing protein [Beijerinckiaceae bacterium]
MYLPMLSQRAGDADAISLRAPPLGSLVQVARAMFCALIIGLVFAYALSCSQARARTNHDEAQFHAFIDGLWPQAKARGISRGTFDRAFKDVTEDPSLLALTLKQPEVVKTLAQYLTAAVSDTRIATGRAKAREWKGVLARAGRIYGVDPGIILGVWGLESNFGSHMGDRSTIRCLATLAFAHYRGDYFKRELIDALEILQAGHVAPNDMVGSWAGAMGQTQFMPSSFKRYAVDFDGGGHKDIWHNVADALGSTANYLRKHGWKTGEPWGYEVALPADIAAARITGSHERPKERSWAFWSQQGLTRVDGGPLPANGSASLLVPAGGEGRAFLVTHNFKVIKTYNNSTSYALGVALLGDRIVAIKPARNVAQQ